MQTVIFGTGEISEIVSEYYREENRFDEIAGYIVDDDYYEDEEFLGKKVVRKSEMKQAFPSDQFRVLIALSYVRLNRLREERYLELKSYGYSFSSFVSKRSVVSKSAQIGENCIILENQTIQPKVVIEPNVMIWSGNHLGHGCRIKAHAYLSSHICISGYTEIGMRTFVGVNSCFADYIKIGSDVFISMGSNVTKNVTEGSLVLGGKSAYFDKEDSLTKKVKNAYFKL